MATQQNLDPISLYKITKTYNEFSTVSTTNDIEIFNIYPGTIIHGIKIKHSVLFNGSGISSCKISVGISGTLNKYTSDFEVYSGVSSTNFLLSNLLVSEDHTSSVSMRAAMTTVGLNINQLTTGSVDFWIYYSKAR